MKIIIILVAIGFVTFLFVGCDNRSDFGFGVGLEFKDSATGAQIVPDADGLYTVEVGQKFFSNVIWIGTAGPSVPPALEGIHTKVWNSTENSTHNLTTGNGGANWTATAVGLDYVFIMARWKANGQGIGGPTYRFKVVDPPGP
ncbi:MAG: hypothetical protein WCJ56_07245 [bacterium]